MERTHSSGIDPDPESSSDLDESLQKSFHGYLEVRGIKHSLHDWLHEYMMGKDEKEYVVWLKNMRDFIGN
ncbi:hypothetical protein D1007_23337 [Hordeum vulgare]|nr:hypothetical protein D1007_23337 [Hordeum vulgare]